MPFYLAPYIGSGTHENPFIVRGQDQDGAGSIDLRPDCTVVDGRALLYLPTAIADPQLIKFGEIEGEGITSNIKNLLGNRLGIAIDDGMDVKSLFFDLLLTHADAKDNGKWNPLVATTRRRLEVIIGPNRWSLPVVEGGASVSDDFDRADGEIGANWIEDAGDIDIVSNKAESQTNFIINRARFVTALDSANHFVQATLGGKATTNCGDVAARIASSADTLYEGVYAQENTATTGFRLRKVVTGSETVLQQVGSVGESGALVFKLTVDGSTQSVERSGSEILTGTDTAIASGLFVGMRVFSDNGGRYDDFSGADLAVGISIPVVVHHLRQQGIS